MTYAFVLTSAFMVVEALAGWWTGSLALLSDAGHMLTDAGAIGISIFAVRLARKPPTFKKTFGYLRVEIVAALLNGLTLWALVGVIFREAWERFQHPREIASIEMAVVAALGLLVNIGCAALLHRHKDDDLNIRGAFLHLLADTLGSVGAIAASIIIWQTGWAAADPIASCLICVLILWSSWGFLKDSINSLLLSVPDHLDYREVEKTILAQPGICCVYDLHIWSIATGKDALSAHAVMQDGSEAQTVLPQLLDTLGDKFNIHHATIQIEKGHSLKSNRNTPCLIEGECEVSK